MFKKNMDNGKLITFLDLKRPGAKIVYGVVVAILLIAVFLSIAPLVFAFLSGFKTPVEYYAVPIKFLPENFDFSRIKYIFETMGFSRYFFNTLVVVIGSIIVQFVTAGITGYVISRIRPKGSGLLFKILMLTIMLPTSMTSVPLFLQFIDTPILHLNLVNTYIPFWIMAGSNAFHILLFKNFFDNIPITYIESASIDGASMLRIFWNIVFPLSTPILITVAIFVFNAEWNSFFWPLLILKDSELSTVGLAIYNMDGGILGEPIKMLAAFIVVVPPVLIYFLLNGFVKDSSLAVGVKE